ncbi:MAG: hypothetical protein N4A38_02210 [Candidatus Gracilibacteria bacterium]|nr:hypothetical protein [Candidatus Gracilibacteria bacterium]
MNNIKYSRRKTRRFLFQRLYANHFGHLGRQELEETFFRPDFLEGMDYDYLDEMYAGIIEKEPEIVYSVSKYAKKFDVKRMKVEQLLPIFIGTYEIMYSRDEIPAKVIVNEAVELAKLFTDDATRKLTNGVLNSILENHLDLVEEASKLEEHKNYFFTKK